MSPYLPITPAQIADATIGAAQDSVVHSRDFKNCKVLVDCEHRGQEYPVVILPMEATPSRVSGGCSSGLIKVITTR